MAISEAVAGYACTVCRSQYHESTKHCFHMSRPYLSRSIHIENGLLQKHLRHRLALSCNLYYSTEKDFMTKDCVKSPNSITVGGCRFVMK